MVASREGRHFSEWLHGCNVVGLENLQNEAQKMLKDKSKQTLMAASQGQLIIV